MVFVHGNPTHSEDWLPFLERIDGPAVALDLPGWGYSEVINAVPLLHGYRWHWVARWFWRRRLVGELANVTMTRSSLRLLSAQATPRPGAAARRVHRAGLARPSAWYLATDAGALPLGRPGPAHAGRGAPRAAPVPALVAWGCDDSYLPPEFAHAYRDRLPDARLRLVNDAGHWPWLDRPDVVDEVVGFLAALARNPPSRG